MFRREAHGAGNHDTSVAAGGATLGALRPDRQRMRPMVLALPLAVMLGLMFLVTSYQEAFAQQRTTCSRARDACGRQPICYARFRDCLETGCWAVWKLRRCGYQKR
jgi:hypothetical protein